MPSIAGIHNAFTPKFSSQAQQPIYHPDYLEVTDKLRLLFGVDIPHCLDATQPAFDAGLALVQSTLVDGEAASQFNENTQQAGRRNRGQKPIHNRYFDATPTGQLQYDLWQRVTPAGLNNDQLRIALSQKALPQAPSFSIRRAVSTARNSIDQLLLKSSQIWGTTTVESPFYKALSLDVAHAVVLSEKRQFPEGLPVQSPMSGFSASSVIGQTPGTVTRRLKIHGHGIMPGALVSIKGKALPNGEPGPDATIHIRLYEQGRDGKQAVRYYGKLFNA